jgi:hypothetical protein
VTDPSYWAQEPPLAAPPPRTTPVLRYVVLGLWGALVAATVALFATEPFRHESVTVTTERLQVPVAVPLSVPPLATMSVAPDGPPARVRPATVAQWTTVWAQMECGADRRMRATALLRNDAARPRTANVEYIRWTVNGTGDTVHGTATDVAAHGTALVHLAGPPPCIDAAATRYDFFVVETT